MHAQRLHVGGGLVMGVCTVENGHVRVGALDQYIGPPDLNQHI